VGAAGDGGSEEPGFHVEARLRLPGAFTPNGIGSLDPAEAENAFH